MEEEKPESPKPAEKQKIILIRSKNCGVRAYTKLDELTAILIILGYDVTEIPLHEYRDNTPALFKIVQWIPTSICGYFETQLAAARLHLIAMLVYLFKNSMNPVLVVVEEISCIFPLFSLYGNVKFMFIDDVMNIMPTLRDLDRQKRSTPSSEDDYLYSVPNEREFRRKIRRRTVSTPKRRFPDYTRHDAKLTDLYQVRTTTTIAEDTKLIWKALERQTALLIAQKERILELSTSEGQSSEQSFQTAATEQSANQSSNASENVSEQQKTKQDTPQSPTDESEGFEQQNTNEETSASVADESEMQIVQQQSEGTAPSTATGQSLPTAANEANVGTADPDVPKLSTVSDVAEMRTDQRSLDESTNSLPAEHSVYRRFFTRTDTQGIKTDIYLNEFGEEIDRETFYQRFQIPEQGFFPLSGRSDEESSRVEDNTPEAVQQQLYDEIDVQQFMMEDQTFNELFMAVSTDEDDLSEE